MSIPRHEESPIEMERRRRQLDVVQGRPITRSTLELHRERQRREVEVEEEEQQRGRRQTTDPDQLCPTVASFVMPRAAVNSQGEAHIGCTEGMTCDLLQETGCSSST